jgi:hypothetical protein
VERVRERGGYLEASPSKLAAASQANLGAPAYLADRFAQRDEIATGDAEHGYTEEPIPFPAVTARPLQVGLAETVASTPDREELVVGWRRFAEDLGWRTSKRHQQSLSGCRRCDGRDGHRAARFVDTSASGSAFRAGPRLRLLRVWPRARFMRAMPARSESVPMWWP